MARFVSRHERVGRAIDRLGGGLLLVLAAGLWGAGESLLAIVGLVLAVLLLLRGLLPPSEQAERRDASRDEHEIEGSAGGDSGTPGLHLHDHDGHAGGGHHDGGDWGGGDLGGHFGGDGGGDGGGGH